VTGGAAAGAPRVAADAGTGILEIERVDGRSRVRRAFASSPLRWLMPANHGGAAWIYAASYGGGLVGGDVLDLRVDIGTGAAAFLSTQASTKVYRSPLGARVRLAATIGPGGLLIAVPDPVVCFAASSYRQLQRIAMDESAGLVLVETMSSGRQGSGERWAFDHYTSRTSVCCGDRLAFLDGLELDPSDGPLADRMGRFDVVAFAVVVGARVAAAAGALLDSGRRRAVPKRDDMLMSVARLGETGTVLRIAATSVEAATRELRRRLAFVPALLGDDPWSRKW